MAVKSDKITDIRKQFDEIDKSILILLGIRTKLSKEMAAYKKENNLSVIQTAAWKKHVKID